MKHVDLVERFNKMNIEVDTGFHSGTGGRRKSARCLNGDVETVFAAPKCIECDACVDICPVAMPDDYPQCRRVGSHARKLVSPRLDSEQDLYVSAALPQTGRIMAKDEDVCVHCGLCAERCPTAAWDMQKFELIIPYAGVQTCNETLAAV